MNYNENFSLEPINYFCEIDQVWKVEEFRPIKNYEGHYEVSDLGRIKSLNYNHTKIPKILSQSQNLCNYKTISFSLRNVKKTHSVHQIVSESFLNHIKCGFTFVVNHKDFDRQNNKLSNLEIVTHRENANRKHLKSTSKYVGVGWHKRIKKWQSRIVVKRKIIHLGYFIDEHEAHLAYQKALSDLQ